MNVFGFFIVLPAIAKVLLVLPIRMKRNNRFLSKPAAGLLARTVAASKSSAADPSSLRSPRQYVTCPDQQPPLPFRISQVIQVSVLELLSMSIFRLKHELMRIHHASFRFGTWVRLRAPWHPALCLQMGAAAPPPNHPNPRDFFPSRPQACCQEELAARKDPTNGICPVIQALCLEMEWRCAALWHPARKIKAH